MSGTKFSFVNLANLEEIELLYQKYLRDPASVDISWRQFFEGVEFASSFAKRSEVSVHGGDLGIYRLIQAYRMHGHRAALINPLEPPTKEEIVELKIESYGFGEEDLEKEFPTLGFLKEATAPLRVLIEALKKTYCSSVGVEYVDIVEQRVEKWIQERIEPFFKAEFSSEEKLAILDDLNRAEIFESFLHTKYVGQKRFSLEGGESFIPLLNTILDLFSLSNGREVVIGMAHRGRLNVLANILGKSYEAIFHEFEDHYSPELLEGTGDVKYHKGFAGSVKTRSGKEVKVGVCANPSHLELVNPIVEGQARALQQREDFQSVIPILVHGDSALSGQGVIYETMQFYGLNGYRTGGTIHVVVNNQIGFTTLPKDSRSTPYCTDIAKSFNAPIFHVNAEDVEKVVYVAKLAVELRQLFACDVFIDLNCYRKYGHNETDEPIFTQPIEYQKIKDKKLIREIYRDQLIEEGVLNQERASQLEEQFRAHLHTILTTVQSGPPPSQEISTKKEDPFSPIETAIPVDRLIALTDKFCSIPEGFNIHPKIKRVLKDRQEMIHQDPNKPSIDWALAEHLAFATLLTEKVHVRFSGQDSRRGTFTQRHAMWVDQEKELRYYPLSHLSKDQAPFDIYNSPLSELAVLGFEFGYSFTYPNSLVIWEAQFGDFCNGAQIVIDQYIAASEQKWGIRSNLTLMLPHGYEGQGPEHSSGRMERFLQLAGQDNIQVVNCTTPAQLFHLLRRQALRPFKKPLILFTPKGLLRHPLCLSPLNAFARGTFEELLDDPKVVSSPKTLLACSGRIYYDLLAEREKRKVDSCVIVRVEQIYPFHLAKWKELVQKYRTAQEWIWVQEEHSNIGPWEYLRPIIQETMPSSCLLRLAARERSSTSATGSHAQHKKQHLALMEEIFAKIG